MDQKPKRLLDRAHEKACAKNYSNKTEQAYVKSLRLLPTNTVVTCSHVDPFFAVILGRNILSEPITIWAFSAAAPAQREIDCFASKIGKC